MPKPDHLWVFSHYEQSRNLLDYVEQRPSERISLNGAAAITRMEVKYFSAFFRRRVGVPYSDWQWTQKIKKAEEIFQTKNISVTEVANRLGFEDLRTFERGFKRRTGMTPIEFKKSVLSNKKLS